MFVSSVKSGMVKALVSLGAVNKFTRVLCTSRFNLSGNFAVKDRHLVLLRNCVSFVKICAAKAALMVVNGILFTAKLYVILTVKCALVNSVHCVCTSYSLV
jgi:hypothetical protein